MSDAVQIYREISSKNPDLLQWLDMRNQLFNVKNEKEGTEHIFIDDSLPRDRTITPLILDETVGFALFDNQGEFVERYETLVAAENAAKNARIVVTTDVLTEA